MNSREEQIRRLALRRAEKLDALTEAGFHELETAVREDPASFVDEASEEAFSLVVQAIERHDAACSHDDLLDDEEFFAERAKRLARLGRDCEEALSIDPVCYDAALLKTLALDLDPERLLGALIELEDSLGPATAASEPVHDLWQDVFARPRLRVKAAVARTCIDTARYRMAAHRAQSAIALAPGDPLGLRHTCALAYARLEDEAAFDELDRRFSRQGSAWSHLARAILLYKLGRMPAARRAIEGYARLCVGGAYALIKPVMVDVYLPDRPVTTPLSFEEATLAVHEADPVVMDVPDFVAWSQGIRSVYFAAEDFARRNDLDW